MFIWTLLLRITHSIISQSIGDSSWITLYILLSSGGSWADLLQLLNWIPWVYVRYVLVQYAAVWMSWNKGNNRNNMHGATIKIWVCIQSETVTAVTRDNSRAIFERSHVRGSYEGYSGLRTHTCYWSRLQSQRLSWRCPRHCPSSVRWCYPTS
jgi:hypothetical protein